MSHLTPTYKKGVLASSFCFPLKILQDMLLITSLSTKDIMMPRRYRWEQEAMSTLWSLKNKRQTERTLKYHMQIHVIDLFTY